MNVFTVRGIHAESHHWEVVRLGGRRDMEHWKDIAGYEGLYQVSDIGNIRSSRTGKMMKLCVNSRNGYVYCVLSNKQKRKNCRVHRLVASAFLGVRDGLQVNHIDGDKANNKLSNLEWVTRSENMKHAFATGLEKKCFKPVIDLDTHEIYEGVSAAAEAVGARKAGTISRVCKGARSHYRNRHFAYYEDYLAGTIPPFKGARRRKSSEGLWV